MSTPAIRANASSSVRRLTLPLLMARVDADHPDDAMAPNDLALLAARLYRCLYLHLASLSIPLDRAATTRDHGSQKQPTPRPAAPGSLYQIWPWRNPTTSLIPLRT